MTVKIWNCELCQTTTPLGEGWLRTQVKLGHFPNAMCWVEMCPQCLAIARGHPEKDGESDDSKALARIVRLAKTQVALNGSISAALGLEMVFRLRVLERALFEIADSRELTTEGRMQIAASALQR